VSVALGEIYNINLTLSVALGEIYKRDLTLIYNIDLTLIYKNDLTMSAALGEIKLHFVFSLKRIILCIS
jgi:hypothetical protein